MPALTGERKIILALIVAIIGFSLVLTNAELARAEPPRIDPPISASTIDPSTPTPPAQLIVWDTCFTPDNGCPMKAPNWWRQWIVPDTYDVHVSFTSNASIAVYFLTLPQYTQLRYCRNTSCVAGSYRSISPTTKIADWVFKLAEGCGDYVAIFQAVSPTVLYPNISITHNPAPFWTGTCQFTGP